MKPPQRGEIWLVDLGMRAKVRPVVVLSIGFQDQERALVTFVARTTQVRGSRFEVVHHAKDFKPGVFDAQSIGTNDQSDFVRYLARCPEAVLVQVEDAVRLWLGLG